jgi:hypothetical protein
MGRTFLEYTGYDFEGVVVRTVKSILRLLVARVGLTSYPEIIKSSKFLKA